MITKTMKILIIEDDVTDCNNFITNAKNRNDVEIVEITDSGIEGLKYAKAKHPDGKFAYHVNSIDDQERILGWINDAQTIEKINSQITKTRLNTLINYLSPEAKEIFYNTIKSSNQGVTESNKDIITTLIREAEQAEKMQNQQQSYAKKSEQEIGDR